MNKLLFFFVAVLFTLSPALTLAQEKNQTGQVPKKGSEQKKESEEEHYVPPPVINQQVLKAKWAEKYKQLRLKKITSSSPVVDMMPSYNQSSAYANAVVGQDLDVWGNVVGGTPPYTFVLDFGDGTPAAGGTVGDPRNISVPHSYASAGVYTVTLTVTDANSLTASSQATVRVFTAAALTQQIRVNMAIERGLKFLYLNQDPSGWWNEDVGSCIMAFEENGHYSYTDVTLDIYANTVNLGLQYILSGAYQYSIYSQAYGNPDADGDGYGVVLNSNTYNQGLDLLGIISGGSKTWAQNTYVANGSLAGKSIYYVVTNAIDQIAFAQTEGYGEGGWRYAISTDNYGNSDNSMTAWITLSLESAQNLWGIDMSQWPFLKSELLKWLQYSQGPDGGFGYTDPGYWENIVKTGSGIGSYAFLGYSSTSAPVANALGFLNGHWNDVVDIMGDPEQFDGNMYALWGVAKALRISDNRAGVSQVGSHDWYNEYVSYLLDTWPQNSDGSFQSWIWLSSGGPLATAFGVLVLTQSVGQSLPVAVIDPTGPYGVGTGFRLNGNRSFDTDPNHHIVDWAWDWDASDGLSWTTGKADGTGPQPYDPGYSKAGVYRITLRVTDDNNLTNTTSIDVVISDTVAHPPIAIAGPETGYNTRVGVPVLLDGRRSYSPDSAKGVTITGYTWDLNGDGFFGDAVTDTTTVVFGSAQQAYVYLKVYDSRGDSSTNVAEVKVTAAQNNLVATSLSVAPNVLAVGDQVQMIATATVDPASDLSEFDNVTVRFYLGDPFTTGAQIGRDHVLSLIKGTVTTIQDTGTVPANVRKGSNRIYVWVDALDRIPEFNKEDNLVSSGVSIILRNLSWKIDILASSSALLDLGSYAGVAGIATDGFDSLFDFPKPPEPPSNYVYVCFPHAEWGSILGPNFFTDVKHDTDLSGSTKVWTFGVATDQFNKPLTVQLIPNADVPANYSVFLKDLKTDSLQDIKVNNTYTYNAGSDSSRAFLIIVGGIKSESNKFGVGWTMVGFPTKANSALSDTMIAGGSMIYLYGYSPSSGYSSIDTVNRGRGYWLGALSPVTATVVGTTVLDLVSVPLNSGFNMISLPYLDSTYSRHQLSISDGSTTLSLDSAVSVGWVSPALYSYWTIGGIYSAVDTLIPWSGYWFAALDTSLQLVFSSPANVPEPSMQAMASIQKNSAASISDSNWYVGLTLSANKSVDRLGGFGVKPGAKSGFDAGYDLPHPPNPPTSDYVYLVFPHPEWGSVIGPNFSADVRAPGNPISWNLTAGFAGKTTTAVLTWDSTGVPAGATIQLSDLGNKSAKVNMKKAGSYRFTINGTDSLTITSVLTAVTQQPPVIPTDFALKQNYPNPFNPATIISYDLPKGSRVVLAVYDDLGRKVRTLVDQEKPAGSYQVVFDASNLPSGVYFYKITAGTFTAAKKLMLVK